MSLLHNISVQAQAIAQNNQPKGDLIAVLSTVGAIVNLVAGILAPIATVLAGALGIVWWIFRIRQTRQETRFAKEDHEKNAGR